MPVETATMRRLREKQRMTYRDELEDDDLDDVSPRTFSVEEKLASTAYNADFVHEQVGSDINMKLFQESGFRSPMVVKDKTGLGMRVPSANFTVNDVKACVGSRRVIDVMDVMTQKGETMTMKDYVSYYNDKADRDRLLNVISLEFSGTKLDNYVEQPSVVHQNDWVDTVWPTDLKEKQSETTNVLEKMFYPKVQRYCLMSVGGCYTDFHIDMGGTSVWYHILHGGKGANDSDNSTLGTSDLDDHKQNTSDIDDMTQSLSDIGHFQQSACDTGDGKEGMNDTGDSKQSKGTGGSSSGGGQQNSSQGSSQSTSQTSSAGSYTTGGGIVGGGGGGAGGGGDGEEPPHKQFKREPPASAPSVSSIQTKQECNVEMSKYVVRPAPVVPPPKQVSLRDGTKHPLDKHIWLYIFSFLDQTDLTRLLSVCKTWYRWSLDSSLWYKLDVSQRRPMRQHHLIGVIRRQPKYLDLSWTNISHQQLQWIVARLPHLKHLLLCGCSWSAVSALCSSSCPLLFSLDLSWVSGTRTQCLRDLLAPPTDHRPGVDDSVSRFHRCTSLSLAGSDITDTGTEYLAMWLHRLSDVTLSFSCQLTDDGIRNLASLPITNLDLSGCKGLTHAVLPVFMEMPQLQEVLLAQCPRITKPFMEQFLKANPGVWNVLPPMGLKRKSLS